MIQHELELFFFKLLKKRQKHITTFKPYTKNIKTLSKTNNNKVENPILNVPR